MSSFFFKKKKSINKVRDSFIIKICASYVLLERHISFYILKNK
jgi:hypothetical protein